MLLLFYLFYQQIDAIEKEEAAGRMTIGMRQEKTNVDSVLSFLQIQLTQQLKSITKKSPQNNNAFKKRIPYISLLLIHVQN